MKKIFYSFLTKNKYIAWLWLFYLIPALAINLSNYPYIDDVYRRSTGVASFAHDYARYASEYLSWILNNNSHLVDVGILFPFLTSGILALSSVLLIRTFFPKDAIKWQTVLASTILFVNPFFLEVLSFRFDNPYIAFSILVSILPFFLYRKFNSILFFFISLICVFLMCNLYQSSSGIHIILTIFLFLYLIIEETSILHSLRFIVISAMAYISGLLVYRLEMNFNPQLLDRGTNTTIAELDNLIPTIQKNTELLYAVVRNEINKYWKILILIIIILFLISLLFKVGRRSLWVLPISIFALGLSFPLSFGVNLAITGNLATDHPRYVYGLFVCVAIISIILAQLNSNKLLKIVKSTTIIFITYGFLVFSFVYANVLGVQKDEFEFQAGQFSQVIRPYLKTDGQTRLVMNRLFTNSTVYYNSLQNYPILDNLVPDNANLYWPNVMWYQNISHYDVKIDHVDTMSLNFEGLTPVEDSPHYEIYQMEDGLYIRMK
ncbi:glucosyltransferase domain-containing protein [Streptococcus sp. NLN64]|uniref:glucosyltransferase domain-containing protein n=1 Tax=Streptococcus sp. NLN64 TaxID=2822799 RepID=UPI0018CB6D47|nr:glucosyltransferase domain-containing protein [Streptococcus sp. NLN64]MBG9366684.1 glucosyltransferase domain-containing protein [Streptococcus sp. NLN64]